MNRYYLVFKNLLDSRFFWIGLFVFIIWGIYSQENNEQQYEEFKCQTKAKSICGVIEKVAGRAGYMVVFVNNMNESINLNISKEKYKKGFSESYSYEVGDSLIKEANSNHGEKL
jgi:hypothetical protein